MCEVLSTYGAKTLLGRKALVTAGPTWVAVDRVRVVTTVCSGETGLAIARHLQLLGAEVDLWMGPGRARITETDRRTLSITNFRYYDDLAALVKAQNVSDYDVIVHSAAVADYKPVPATGKIRSGLNELTLTLRPTEKLVDILRERAPEAVLVKFKLETGLDEDKLLAVARNSRAQSKADLIVANRYEGMSAYAHEAFILDGLGTYEAVKNKRALCTRLGELITEQLVSRTLCPTHSL